MRAYALVLLAACAAWCDPYPLPPEPIPPPDPTPQDDDCGRAEDTICRLECETPKGDPLCEGPTGVGFAERCRDEIEKGMPWDARCLSSITSCDQIDAAVSGELCREAKP